jgi:hypothetical protein
MFRFPIQIAARFAVYAGVRSLTESALTENFGMEPDAVELPATATGVVASFVVGPYTDGIVNVVANKIQARRERKSVAE